MPHRIGLALIGLLLGCGAIAGAWLLYKQSPGSAPPEAALVRAEGLLGSKEQESRGGSVKYLGFSLKGVDGEFTLEPGAGKLNEASAALDHDRAKIEIAYDPVSTQTRSAGGGGEVRQMLSVYVLSVDGTPIQTYAEAIGKQKPPNLWMPLAIAAFGLLLIAISLFSFRRPKRRFG